MTEAGADRRAGPPRAPGRRRCSCPTFPASARRTTTAPSAAPSLGCRTPPPAPRSPRRCWRASRFPCATASTASPLRAPASRRPTSSAAAAARAPGWSILAAVLGINLRRVAESEHGAAFGAARLARLAVTGEDPAVGLHASGRAGNDCTGPGPRRRLRSSHGRLARALPGNQIRPPMKISPARTGKIFIAHSLMFTGQR